MIPKEILDNIRRIHIVTSRMVTDVFSGSYQSVFKGRGMEFHEVRKYQPGDDIRFIDWNVTARRSQPYVKKFVEERELTVMLVLDASMSCLFGSADKLKRELIAEVSSLLAFSAIRNNDKVGLLIFTGRVEKFVPPRKGTRHVLRVIREALYFRPEGRRTNIAAALEYLTRVTTGRTITFLISDFIDSGYKTILSVANKRHDIIAVTVTDPSEIELPEVGILKLKDSETGEEIMVDTGDKRFRQEYKKEARRRIQMRKRMLGSCGVDSINLKTNEPYSKELVKFFRMRQKRMA